MIFVSDRIEEIVRTKPNLPAVVTEDDETFTYKQFNQQAEIIAEMLIDVLQLDSITTFQETQMVGLLMERTMAVVTMFLAIHKAGCAYVPVDPAFPPDRQSYILEHSKCNVLIVDEECFEGAKKQNMEIPAKNVFVSDKQGRIITRYVDGREVSLQEGRRELSAGTMKRVRELNRNAESIAYVLYTSGSTGKPKGVAVKQVGVDNIIKFFADELKVGPSDSVMGLTTFCFDISVLETFVPLTRGGVFVLAKSATRKDPFHILELMETHKVTIFQATPTTYEMMMATGWNGDAKVKFLIGGEAFRPTLLPLAKNCADLLNVYGPTETTIWSTFYRVGAEFEDYARSLGIKGVPIGKAISDTTLYLVGENQPWKEVAFGEEGELFIGGIGVAAGYLHAPHLTKDRFIPNPFGEGLVYRTGDSVKQLPDGNYIFMRRLDDQVKIDGFRIELEEIEKVYMQHEAVDKAVALVREKKIVIYIKPQESIVVKRMMTSNGEEYELEKEMLDSINADASKHLTYYMMPKFNVILLDFPKTPNGKLDKKALPTPRVLLEQVAHEEEKAANLAKQHTEGVKAIAVVEHYDGERPVSAFICDSVAQLRGVRPQVTSSLSTFGLDSLGSVMLLRQISTSLKGEIPIKMQDLFAINTTIKSLGQTLYNRASEATRKKLKLIPEKEGDEATFLEEGEVLGEENNIIHQPDYFGTVLLSNRRLMDGLRGLFTLMVLYDHWHSDRVYVTTALNVDTTLFYMISGFTTAAQLRVLPIIKKEPSNSIKTGGKVLTTSPKPAMDLGNFFLIRAVGLYPIMWLSLIINIPIWRDQDKYQFPHHEAGMPQEKGAAACSFLYVIGMNVWSQTCTSRGPDVRYASGLIITMMFYGFFRYYWTKILRYFSRLINLTSLTTVSNGYHDSNINLRDPNQSWTDYFGKVSVYLGYNLYHPEVLLYYSIVYVILMFGFFWQNAFANAKLVTSVEYFAITAFLLVICEMICGQRIIQLQQEKKQDEQSPVRGSKAATKAQQQYEAPPVIEEDLSSPWDVLQGYYDPIVRPMRQTMNQGYQAVFGGELFDNNDNDVREEDKKTKEEEWSLIGLLWRFSPDIIIVLCLISFSCLGDLCHNTTLINAIENVVVPTAFLLYLVIVLSQRGKSRYNLSRLILETEIMNQIGYASYPIYLIQNAFLQYYFTYMVHHHNYSYHGRNPGRGFFRNLPFKYRFGCTFFVIFIGWVIQKYYQDWFITGMFAKVLSWWRQRNTNNNSANNHHRGNKYRVIHVSKKDQDHDDDNHGSVIIDDIIHHHEININKEENKADEVRNVKSSKRISNEDRPIYASL